MTADLPDNLRSLDDQLMNALSVFAPPKDLDAKILDHVSRRTRPTLVPSPLMIKTAAAVVAVGLLAGVGYVADQQLNGGGPLATASNQMTLFNTSIDLVQDRTKATVDEEQGWSKSAPTGSMLHGDGPADWQETPYKGLQQDNAFSYGARKQPSDADNRVLLPVEGENPEAKEALRHSYQNPYANAGAIQPGFTFDVSNAPDFSLTDNKNAPGGGGGGGGNGKDSGLFGGKLGVDHFKPGQSPARPNPVGTAGSEGRTRANTGLAVADVDKDGVTSKQLEGLDATRTGETATHKPYVEPPAVVVAPTQRVIRNGVVEFEVDSFDTALITITKLVVEQGGFVASTDSAKLPNGKTRGAVTLRIPPERLDTFVLMLRGVGDLKSQKISAQDVSKTYSDIESQLKAARAMETRLLEMIQKGQGAIKDLLAAEKELGVWREKIEKFEGEKRYYDNLISLSTLTVTLQERDIKASSATIETESVTAGVETDDVEKARAEIIKSIDEAKGRIISSDLKKLDAGQFASTIVAEVEPDRAGPVVDRLKQLGKVARLDVGRKQTTVDGTGRPVPGAHVEKKPTTLTISLYNLANVAPRLTTSATLASDNVEDNYRQIMAIVEKEGGRVVTSQLQRPQPDQVQATLQIEVPSAQAAATQTALQALGETMNLQLSENPDTANVTTAKQGFSVRIISAASVPARETTTLQLAAKDVSEAHRALQVAAEAAGAQVVQSNVTEGDRDNVNAVLQLDLARTQLAAWDKAQQAAGEVLTRSVVRSSETQNTLDSKVRLSVSIYPIDKLPPRQMTSATIRVSSAEASQQTFLAQATQLGGRIIDQSVSRDTNGRSMARLVFDIPRDQTSQLINDLRSAGEIRVMNTSTNPQAPDGALSRTRFDLQLAEGEALVGSDDGVWSSIKAGLATSLQGLGWSVRLLVIGVCLVAPWALVLWGGWKLIRRKKAAPKEASLAV